jgi:hypothetical protein
VTAATERRLWLVTGSLLIGYIVLTFAGVAFEHSLMLGDSPTKATAALVSSSMARNFAGGYVEFLAQLVLLAGALLLARLVRVDGPTGDWLASCMTAAMTAAVAVTVATGFAAGAAALYDGHHGAALATATTVNDIRNFGFFLTGGLIGMFALATGVSVLMSGAMARWVAYSAIVVGVLYLAAVPAARTGVSQGATMIGFLWTVAVGIAAVRQGRRSVVAARAQAALGV